MTNLHFFLDRLAEVAVETAVPASDLIACTDLTSLNGEDTSQTILALCQKAATHQVAAVCVYPAFVRLCHEYLTDRQLETACQVATVVNFPSGTSPLNEVLRAIDQSLAHGASEIDVVVPYQQFLKDHDGTKIKTFVKACKQLCGTEIRLKTILESGVITDTNLLEQLSLAALEGGSDFLKTSTGKIPEGASLEAAAVMLGALKAFGDPARGFKASGGIRTYQQATIYWVLAQYLMGIDWLNSGHFRFGASSLLDDLLGATSEASY
jgi:deoxyribose-phosphate aldolase